MLTDTGTTAGEVPGGTGSEAPPAEVLIEACARFHFINTLLEEYDAKLRALAGRVVEAGPAGLAASAPRAWARLIAEVNSAAGSAAIVCDGLVKKLVSDRREVMTALVARRYFNPAHYSEVHPDNPDYRADIMGAAMELLVGLDQETRDAVIRRYRTGRDRRRERDGDPTPEDQARMLVASEAA